MRDSDLIALTINGRETRVPPGTTVLDAAQTLGIEIPVLCYMEGCKPFTTCFVCAVRIEGKADFAPGCAVPVAEGMVVHTDTDDVSRARRTAIELLLSDHVGECEAPCSLACPAHLDIPCMMAAVAEADHERAFRILVDSIPLPASLGRICAGYCQRACRRKEVDAHIAICDMKRAVWESVPAERRPELASTGAGRTGKRIAIVGAGAAGLTCAFCLNRLGHDCTVFEARDSAGGWLRHGFPEEELPKATVDAEIAFIEACGIELKYGRGLVSPDGFRELRDSFSAVVLAIGAGSAIEGDAAKRHVDTELVAALGVAVSAKNRIEADRDTSETAIDGVFATGECVAGAGPPIRAIAAGQQTAAAVDQYVRGAVVTGAASRFRHMMDKLTESEAEVYYGGVEPGTVLAEGEFLTPETAPLEAARCLQCACAARDDCALRDYATEYGASQRTYRGDRREFTRDSSSPSLVYESGKCILCGRCVAIAAGAGDRPGLSFVKRGFLTRVAVPLDGTLSEAVSAETAARIATHCPTGAMAHR